MRHPLTPPTRAPSARILMYSHDTYGLGHIRRTRAIANALVGADDRISILIVSGSALAGSFNFGPGVDFVHVPGVTKTPAGDYESANIRLDLAEVVRLRQSIIRETAESFRPDIFIADKEPAGFSGEILPALKAMGAMGTHRILGLRDVLDEPEALRAEWHEKGALRAMTENYDELLVYGPAGFYRPLEGMPLPAHLQARTSYSGYLRRSVPGGIPVMRYPKSTKEPFILVTTGGGADGAALIDWVISAYEHDSSIPLPSVIAFGPFLSTGLRRNFMERIDRLAKVDWINFDPKIERLMNRAAGVVAMGGYNTFCEILSFDKPALLAPRSQPRLEQTIRARRAVELGLMQMIEDPQDSGAGPREPARMAEALKRLCVQKPPSAAGLPDLLDGLPNIVEHLAPILRRGGLRRHAQYG